MVSMCRLQDEYECQVIAGHLTKFKNKEHN